MSRIPEPEKAIEPPVYRPDGKGFPIFLVTVMSMNCAKAPRFTAFKPTSEKASKTKSRNKARNTKAEVLLRKALWGRGIRYRLHVKGLVGKPDIVFPKQKVVVFVDGDFWHGRNWTERKKKLKRGANADYWIAKIQYNRNRDKDQTAELKRQGWTVIRLWETDVARDLDSAVGTVITELLKRT